MVVLNCSDVTWEITEGKQHCKKEPYSATFRTPNETEKKPLSTGFKGVSSEPVLKIQVLSSPRPTKSEILRSAI